MHPGRLGECMAANRILIVEDDRAIADSVALNLKYVGYEYIVFDDGQKAADYLGTDHAFDLALLDIMLPGVNGYELLEYCRELEVPAVFLTAKAEVEDRVKGLRLGAEDYLPKPFALPELLARVETVLRRCHKTGDTLSLAGLVADPRARRVWRDGEEIALTPKEYDLLLLFLRNPNAALYRDTIYERVWGGELAYGSKTVDLHIQRLRRKVGWEGVLVAVNKVGYRLEVKP